MKKRNVLLLVVVTLILGVVVVTITENVYTHNHIMVYAPTSDEELLIANEYGINLTDDLSISSVLLDYSYADKESIYAIRIEGANDIYSFLTTNVVVDGDVSCEEGVVCVNGIPIVINNGIYNYERNELFEGGSIVLYIFGGHDARNNGEAYKMRVTFSFFFVDGELSFIECGSHCYPFGDDCSNKIREQHYWEDYVFFPVVPLLK